MLYDVVNVKVKIMMSKGWKPSQSSYYGFYGVIQFFGFSEKMSDGTYFIKQDQAPLNLYSIVPVVS